MPGRSRNPPASDPVMEEADTTMDGGAGKLRFQDPLSWRAGRAISVADLLKSLKKLADELKEHEQGSLDLGDLRKVALQLAGAHLLAHKDKGIRAWTAVCIVDILMLSAPNAPFSGSQLRDIFTTLITSIIPALADPSNAYNHEHIHVLHSLAEYQSIILLTDLDGADSLILSLFTTCFDIISNSSKASTGEELVKNVEFDMTRVLVTIIDEVPSLNPEVVDTIIVQFLRVDSGTASQPDKKGKKNALVDNRQGTLRNKEYPPAYNMAKAICSSCPEKMTNHISTYFNNIILDASDSFPNLNGSSKHSHKRPSSVDDLVEDNDDFQQLKKAHKLIRELWRACPDVLHNVIPQLEAELGADSVPLRTLATETLGDVTAGIGVAGLPSLVHADPGAWPPMRLGQKEALSTNSPLTTPMSPKPFSQTHVSAYDSFFSRRHDKSPSVRAIWAVAVGRILLTSGGGLGLDTGGEEKLVTGLTHMLSDAEEKVRLAAVEAVAQFGFTDIVNRLGRYGAVSKEGSLLAQLAERLKDKRHPVREAAFAVLGKNWGIGAYEIEQGNDAVIGALGHVPLQILNTFFTNDPDIQLLMDKTIFEQMIPFTFPPVKPDKSKSASQKQTGAEPDDLLQGQIDPDHIRLRRILTFNRDLDEKGRKVFQALMQRQVKLAQIMTAYLQTCENYNGGVVETGEAEIKSRLTKLAELISKSMPDSSRVSADLLKFAKNNDKRAYQLIRFAMSPESDYRTVVKAIKELTKRIQTGPTALASLLDTLTPLLHRCSLLFLNRSHIPAVIQISRSNENGLGLVAHDVLRIISTLCPAVLKTQIQDMCKGLESNAPSVSQTEEAGAADTLKACAGFARKFPEEMPKDRKFHVAMTNYALYSRSPRAAKHAVTILMQSAEKKEMYANDLIGKAVKYFSTDSDHALASLATIAQISLLAPTAANGENDVILQIALDKVLLHESPTSVSSENQYTWSDEVSTSLVQKEWALRILVNRLRSYPEESTDGGHSIASFRAMVEPVYRILNLLVSNEGELHKSNSTPATERPRLRLIAAKLLLKICSHRRVCDELLTPENFNAIALLAQDRLLPVRKGFVEQLKRYLTANRLSARWYTVLFLLAFEPDAALRVGTSLWLKNQSQQIIRSARSTPIASGKPSYQNVVELLFARLLSLLAHHVDYPAESDTKTYAADLLDFTRYILFYLTSVSNEDNLSLIFHISQRVKQTRDGIADSPELEEIYSERLYTLSDLSQAIIRVYADVLSTSKGHEKGVNLLQTWPGKLRLPGNIFKTFESSQRELAHGIAEKDFLANVPDLREEIEEFVRKYMRSTTGAGKIIINKRKRKTEGLDDVDDDEEDEDVNGVKKKARSSGVARLPIRKASHSTVAKKRRQSNGGQKPSEEPSRKSSRKSGSMVNYADRDSSDDDLEMDEWDKPDPNSSSVKGKTSTGKTVQSSSPVAQVEGEPDTMDVDEKNDDLDPQHQANQTPKPSSPSRLHHNPPSGPKINGTAKPSTPASTSKPSKSKPKATKRAPTKGTKARGSKSANDDDLDDDMSDDDEIDAQDSKAAMSAIAKKHQSKLKGGPSSGLQQNPSSSTPPPKQQTEKVPVKGKRKDSANVNVNAKTNPPQPEEEGGGGEEGGKEKRGGRTLRNRRGG